VGPRRRPKVDEAFAAGEHALLNENQTTTCSRSRAQLRLLRKGSLMPDSTQSSDGVIRGSPSSKSVAQFLAGRHHLEGALRAPFDAVESIVEALVGA
jgi:hypothetical protein